MLFTCVIHGLMKNSISFLLSILSGAWVSNVLLMFGRYSFIEKLTSFFSLYKFFSQFIGLKAEINLLLSNFSQLHLRILDFVAGILEKNSVRKQISYFNGLKCHPKLREILRKHGLVEKLFINSPVKMCNVLEIVAVKRIIKIKS